MTHSLPPRNSQPRRRQDRRESPYPTQSPVDRALGSSRRALGAAGKAVHRRSPGGTGHWEGSAQEGDERQPVSRSQDPERGQLSPEQ